MAEDASLAALGLTEEQETAYRVLIEMPGASEGELARAAGRSLRETRRLLSSLEEIGLATRVAGDATAFVPEPPGSVLGLMVQERQRELEAARAAAQELAEVFRHRAHPSEEAVSVVSGKHAVSQRYMQMLRDARSEFLIFDTAPYVPPSQECEDIQVRGMADGVRYRCVYQESALEVPGQLESLERLARAGQETRITHDVPMKLAVQDRSVGLIPFHEEKDALDRVLLVQGSALLAALLRLFEEVWAHASPLRVPLLDEGNPVADGGRAREERRILALLAAGLKDESIARQLDLSVRTVERRVAELMTRLNARTRFECGIRAVEAGLIRSEGSERP